MSITDAGTLVRVHAARGALTAHTMRTVPWFDAGQGATYPTHSGAALCSWCSLLATHLLGTSDACCAHHYARWFGDASTRTVRVRLTAPRSLPVLRAVLAHSVTLAVLVVLVSLVTCRVAGAAGLVVLTFAGLLVTIWRDPSGLVAARHHGRES